MKKSFQMSVKRLRSLNDRLEKVFKDHEKERKRLERIIKKNKFT